MTIRERLSHGRKLLNTVYKDKFKEEDIYFIEDYSVEEDVVLYIKAREGFDYRNLKKEPTLSDLEEIIICKFLEQN